MSRKRYFQWIDGENKGQVVTLIGIDQFEGETFYHFDDGEDCNARYVAKMTNSIGDLREKFVVEIEGPSNAWGLEERKPKTHVEKDGTSYEIPTLHDILQAHGDGSEAKGSDAGALVLVPPRMMQHIIDLPTMEQYPMPNAAPEIVEKPVRRTLSELEPHKEEHYQETVPVQQQPTIATPALDENIIQRIVEMTVDCIEQNKAIAEQFNEPEVQQTQNVPDPNDPVTILVSKCKRHETHITLDLTLSLPSRSTYEFAKNEFDNGGEKFVNCIVSELDRAPIIEFLGDAFRKVYEQTGQVS